MDPAPADPPPTAAAAPADPPPPAPLPHEAAAPNARSDLPPRPDPGDLFDVVPALREADLGPLPSPDPAAPPHAPIDPWAHRRGEPRLLALLWIIYVFTAVAGSVLWVARFAQVTASNYAPAARIMLVVLGVGVTILWPMTRLSQATPRRTVLGSTLADLLVILLPVQAVLWPLVVLAEWTPDTVLGLAAMLAAWALLAGGVIAAALAGRPLEAYGEPHAIGRTAWMLALVLLVGAAPAARLLVPPPSPPWLPMASPLTAVAAITGAGVQGPDGPVSPLQWRVILLIAGAGLGAWTLAAIRSALGAASRRA